MEMAGSGWPTRESCWSACRRTKRDVIEIAGGCWGYLGLLGAPEIASGRQRLLRLVQDGWRSVRNFGMIGSCRPTRESCWSACRRTKRDAVEIAGDCWGYLGLLGAQEIASGRQRLPRSVQDFGVIGSCWPKLLVPPFTCPACWCCLLLAVVGAAAAVTTGGDQSVR